MNPKVGTSWNVDGQSEWSDTTSGAKYTWLDSGVLKQNQTFPTKDSVSRVDFANDHNWISVAHHQDPGDEQEVNVYNYRTGSELSWSPYTSTGIYGERCFGGFSKDDSTFGYAGRDDNVYARDTSDWSLIGTSSVVNQYTNGLAVSNEGIVRGESYDGDSNGFRLTIYDLPSFSRTLSGRYGGATNGNGGISTMVFNPWENRFVANINAGSIHILEKWDSSNSDASTWSSMENIDTTGWSIRDLDWSTGDRIAVGLSDNLIILDSGLNTVLDRDYTNLSIQNVDFFAGGTRLAMGTSGSENKIRILNTSDWSVVRKISKPPDKTGDFPNTLSVSKDNEFASAWGSENVLMYTDEATWKSELWKTKQVDNVRTMDNSKVSDKKVRFFYDYNPSDSILDGGLVPTISEWRPEMRQMLMFRTILVLETISLPWTTWSPAYPSRRPPRTGTTT